jgi:hypothetical protein
VTAFNWTQQQLWNAGIERWENQIANSPPGKGIRITEEMKRDLAEVNNTLLAMAPAQTTFGQALRRVLRPFMWSPTFTWSRLRTPSLILTNPSMRGEVASTMASFLGSGVMMMMAARIIGGWWYGDEKDRDEIAELDPRSTDFGKIKIGNTRFDVFGDVGPYLRALAQLATGEKKGQGGRVRHIPRRQVLEQFARNKRAPFFETLNKIIYGKTWYGGPAWEVPEGIEDKTGAKIGYLVGKEAYDTFVPFFLRAFIEATYYDGVGVGIAAGTTEFFSGQTVSYEPTIYTQMQIKQDATAMMTFGKVWDDLSPSQQNKLRRVTPAIIDLERQVEDEQARRGPAEEISLDEQNRAATVVQSALSKSNQDVLKHLKLRIPGFSRKLGEFWLNDRRYETYQVYATEEIDQVIERAITAKAWAATPEVRRKDIVEKQIDFAKQRAREKLMREIERSNGI